ARGAPIFLLGDNPGAAESCAERMRDEFPSVRIVGLMAPPVGFEQDPVELADIKTALAAAEPDIVYLALGFPKQEELALELASHLPTTWFAGVGISFSFVSGEVQRAPRWMQGAGREWIHRLVQEPRRLFRRYLVDGVPFALRMFHHSVRTRSGRST